MKDGYSIAIQRINDAFERDDWVLDLSALRLRNIPPEIEKLSHIQNLDLSFNNLNQLPVEFNNLKSLKTLNLSHNCFTHLNGLGFDFPCSLPVEDLDLSSNLIGGVIEDIYLLENIQEVELRNNPLNKVVPLEIISQGFHSIFNFLEELKLSSLTHRLMEAKLILVGQGEVGKTTLMKKMINTHLSVEIGQEETTHGINIDEWNLTLALARNQDKFYMKGDFKQRLIDAKPKLHHDNYYEHIDDEDNWEFDDNEEEVEYIDGKFNIWDFGGQEIYYSTHQFFLTKRSIYLFIWDARKEEDYTGFEYWLNIIKALGEDSPVLVVMNKSDIRLRNVDEAELRKQFKNIHSFHQVSCITNEGIERLKHDLIYVFKTLPHIGTNLPKQWVDIKNSLSRLKEDFIMYEDYLKICDNYSIPESRANYLSDYYHDSGNIIHYKNDKLLSDIVILNPQWATDAFYKFIDDLGIQKQLGKFSHDDVVRVLDKNHYPKSTHHYLLKVMERFEICFSLIGTEFYIIPELLNNRYKAKIDELSDDSLKHEYTFQFMPSGIIPRFICRTYQLIKKDRFWKSGVILSYDNTEALVSCHALEKKIVVVINGQEPLELLGIIRHNLEAIYSSLNLNKNNDYHESVPCKCTLCRSSLHPFYFKLSVLKLFKSKGKEYIECQQSAEQVSIPLITRSLKQKKAPEESLLYQIIIACNQLQSDHMLIDKKEDSRNKIIANNLNNRGYPSMDQTRSGRSPSGKSQGELDIKIYNRDGMSLAIFEGLNLKVLDQTKIKEHIDKLFGYDSNGLPIKYMVIYSDSKKFLSLWEKYLVTVDNLILINATLKSSFIDLSEEHSYGNGLKIGMNSYMFKDEEYKLYHLFLNMNP